MADGKMRIFSALVLLCQIRDGPRLPCRQRHIRRGIGVWAGGIPDQNAASLPRTTVIPSGRFPSELEIPVGSRCEGILADAKDLFTMSLISAWREWRPELLRQLSPCVARWSTSAPHRRQRCGWHRVTPRRSPTATRMISSSIRRPKDDIGSA